MGLLDERQKVPVNRTADYNSNKADLWFWKYVTKSHIKIQAHYVIKCLCGTSDDTGWY